MANLDTAKIHEKLKFRRNRLLDRVRRDGPVGRLQLARLLRMSNTRVCEIAQEMLDEGLVLEEFTGNSRRGRRPVPLRVNPGYGHLVGVDVEAKRMRLVAVDFAGNRVFGYREALSPPASREAFIARLLTFIETGLKEIPAELANVLGIGLAAPGVVDVRSGTLLHYDLLEVARDLPLRDLVASRTGLPTSLDENIRCYTRAEWMSGAARHLSSFICLAVRSGVSAGLVLGGRLHEGSHGFAGKAGYFPICGNAAASRWKTLMETVSEQALGVDVEAANYELSDSRARRAGELIGGQIAMMATLLDPEAIVLAGGLVQPDGPLWPSLERTYRRFVLPDIAERVQLLPSRLGPYAAAIGAAHRCFEMLYPTEAAG